VGVLRPEIDHVLGSGKGRRKCDFGMMILKGQDGMLNALEQRKTTWERPQHTSYINLLPGEFIGIVGCCTKGFTYAQRSSKRASGTLAYSGSIDADTKRLPPA